MDEKPLIVPMTVSFEGGGADQHRLDFYDGASALFGFAKTLQLSTHYLKNGKVCFQAPSTKGVKIFMLPSKSGSFRQNIQIVLDNRNINVISANGQFESSVATASIVADFTQFMIRRTIGKSSHPMTDLVRRIQKNNEPDLDALSEAIDGPLKEAHRTIAAAQHGVTALAMRGENLVAFNFSTYEYLATTNVSAQLEERRGSVAAFNVNSRRGRFYDAELGRTVPFTPTPRMKTANATPLSWSLDQRTRGMPGDVAIGVQRVTTVDGDIKRFILVACRRI